MSDAPTILIVEDERVVARDLQKSLVDRGYHVPATAASAVQALELAEHHRPALVIMDIRIKGDRDGIQTATELIARFAVPVIYMSAYTDAVTRERAHATNPFGYLQKPVKLDELCTLIAGAIGRGKS